MTKRQLRQWAVAVLLFLIVSGISYASSRLVRLSWEQFVGYETPYAFDLPTRDIASGPSSRVVLVVIDSLTDEAAASMKSWQHLQREGSTWNLTGAVPSQNLPAWATLVTGTDPDIHGTATGLHTRPMPVDDLFSAARRSGCTPVFAGHRDWEILFGTSVDRARYQFLPPTEDPGPDPDRDSLEFILEHLASAERGLFVLNLTTLNQVALTSGASVGENRHSPYMERVLQYDEMLDQLLQALDLSRDSILVVSSHGTTNRGAFGGGEPEVIEVPAVAAGRGIAPSTTATAEATAVAPTLAVLMGCGFPAHSTGLPVTDALEMDTDQKSEVMTAALTAQLPFYQQFLTILDSDMHLPHPDESEVSGPEEVAAAYRAAREAAVASQLARERRARLPLLLISIAIGLVWTAIVWRSEHRRTMLFGLPLMVATGFGIMYFMGARFSLTDIKTAANFALWFRGLRAQGFLVTIALGMMSGLLIARHGNYTWPQLIGGTLHTLTTSMIALMLFAGGYLYWCGWEISWTLPHQPLWIASFAAITFIFTMGQAALLALGMSWLGAILTVHWWLD
ncbi:MAG: alkaline phosphatase family protein [Bacillota bacterium]